MVFLAYGSAPRIVHYLLSSTQRYIPEHIKREFKRVSGLHAQWLIVENTRIPIRNEPELALACEVTCAYHNGVCVQWFSPEPSSPEPDDDEEAETASDPEH